MVIEHVMRSLFPNCFTLLLLLIGCLCCRPKSSRQPATDPVKAEKLAGQSPVTVSTDTLCFRQFFQRDTTTLQLILKGDQATGLLMIRPFEKDQARGPFTGKRTGNTIQADWQRAGEGVTETYALSLTLAGDTISWGEGERVKRAGKWVLATPTGTYQYRLTKTDCH